MKGVNAHHDARCRVAKSPGSNTVRKDGARAAAGLKRYYVRSKYEREVEFVHRFPVLWFFFGGLFYFLTTSTSSTTTTTTCHGRSFSKMPGARGGGV